jgi:hypothetical protein
MTNDSQRPVPVRARSRASAKAAGSRHETQIAGYLATHLDDRIERRARNGAKDRGDLSGLRMPPSLGGGRIVAELKNVSGLHLTGWYREACIEAGNDDAVLGLLIHKAHGVSAPGAQWVTMTVDDLIVLLCGSRPEPFNLQGMADD